ncbi:unnamed protein product [Oppiella nova]|uniref:Coiled-coil domain-containing protein 12 n=1 Tax=Oppiella nova TaxID=334625 RepID=A0A7R9QQB6_9ACAR|nr:unnamed protein product [Oppiella nova]CAG2171668.1 unnamed protein product [Oppiella nova]
MKSEDSNVGHMEEEARRRKERLERLKSKTTKENTDNNHQNSDDKQVLPKPHFRSYNPNDETLKERSLPKAKPESVEEQIKDQLLELTKEEPVIDEVDLTSLAPRKVDWDLKRNLQKKLDKLENRTQKAIAELIRERLRETSATDLVAATQDLEATQKADDSDDD